MKKHIITILAASILSLAAITGCGDKKEAAPETQKTETVEPAGSANKTTAEKDTPETWGISEKELENAEEGTVYIAPAVDADGNLPEDFDPDSYDGSSNMGTEKETAGKK